MCQSIYSLEGDEMSIDIYIIMEPQNGLLTMATARDRYRYRCKILKRNIKAIPTL